jgi:hypothetical protein
MLVKSLGERWISCKGEGGALIFNMFRENTSD